MSNRYLITLVEPKKIPWRISLSEFTQALAAQWADAEIKMIEDSSLCFCLQWEREVEEGRLGGLPSGYLRGNLFDTLDALSFHGYPEDIIEFGVWFRQYVPEEYPLFFHDQAWQTKTLIYPGMTYSELIDAAFLDPLGIMSEEEFLALMQYSTESNWAAVRKVLCRNIDPLYKRRGGEFREAVEERLDERIVQVLEQAGAIYK